MKEVDNIVGIKEASGNISQVGKDHEPDQTVTLMYIQEMTTRSCRYYLSVEKV